MSILVVNTEIKMEEKKRRNFRDFLKEWSEEEYKNDFQAGRFNKSKEYKNEHEYNWENDIPNLEW